jgi:CBS domain-containing protein
MSILVRHAMTEHPQTIRPDMNAADAAGMMRSEGVGVLPVVDGDEMVGLVTDRDLVVRVLAARRDPTEVLVREIATTAPSIVSPDMKLSEARELMKEKQIRRLLVAKGDELVGILSLGDVAWADASDREVGETLRRISDSDETRAISEGPAMGTPERAEGGRT